MKHNFSLYSLILLASSCLISPLLNASEAITVDQLLQQVRKGHVHDAKVNAERIHQFKQNKKRQQQLLTDIKVEQVREEARSKKREVEFEKNDAMITKQEQLLNERLGSLKELFGVIQQTSSDASGLFENSLTRIQFPDRSDFTQQLAQKMGETHRLASMDEIERLWFEMQREMIESGKVVTINTPVVGTDGVVSNRDVTRVGVFNLLANGKYLRLIPETGKIVELPRQPHNRYLNKLENFLDQSEGMHPVALDPSRGQLLSLLVRTPNLLERIEQGGVIGYVIVLLGAVALLVALERLVKLIRIKLSIQRQINNIDQSGNNPLGRILNVYHSSRTHDVESLELKLGEAILKELPAVNRRLMLLKIIAVVAPLLGLLGTVTGMIITFQAITLFGTGDPKLMAGGISTALITTVMGLCVAIPTVLLHTLVASQSKCITQILEEQSVGMIAEHAENMQMVDA